MQFLKWLSIFPLQDSVSLIFSLCVKPSINHGYLPLAHFPFNKMTFDAFSLSLSRTHTVTHTHTHKKMMKHTHTHKHTHTRDKMMKQTRTFEICERLLSILNVWRQKRLESISLSFFNIILCLFLASSLH